MTPNSPMEPTPSIDRYTKAVLTVIAGCLLFQCALAAGRVVEAQQMPQTPQTPPPQASAPFGQPQSGQAGVIQLQPQPVIIVGWDTTALSRQPPLPVWVAGSETIPVNLAMPVKLTYSPDTPLPVTINGVKKASGQWDSINVHVDLQDMTRAPIR